MLVHQAAVHLSAAFCLSLKMLKNRRGKDGQKSKQRAQIALASEKSDKWGQEWWLMLNGLRLMGKGRLRPSCQIQETIVSQS